MQKQDAKPKLPADLTTEQREKAERIGRLEFKSHRRVDRPREIHPKSRAALKARQKMTDQQILSGIVADYRPYDTLEAFGEGFVAYKFGNYRNPYDGKNELQAEVNAQAWDRGANAAMRFARATAGCEWPRYLGTEGRAI